MGHLEESRALCALRVESDNYSPQVSGKPWPALVGDHHAASPKIPTWCRRAAASVAAVAATAGLALLVLTLVVHPGQQSMPTTAPPGYSKLWGIQGELWDPAGKLPDFSFAGYRQGNAPLPNPPVTRSVMDFKQPGMSDTDVLQAAVGWANSQPLEEGDESYIVLSIPEGSFTLEERITINRSRVVLRGAGVGKTVFDVPKSLTDIYGPDNTTETGGYVNWGGFFTIKGTYSHGGALAIVTGTANRGSPKLQVIDASQLKVGAYYDMWWTDTNGTLLGFMFDNKAPFNERAIGHRVVKYTTKIVGISRQTVTLERPLPYPIGPDIASIEFVVGSFSVVESGVEGLTLRFKWELYAGHHCERGWNAVELEGVGDCWARDIEAVNPDSGILINRAASITVTGVTISYTKTRANDIPNPFRQPTNADGHWGICYSISHDCLMENFTFSGHLNHDVGTGMGGQWGVFANGRMEDGNLDLHRGNAGPTLYTNIDVGKGSKALASGGPSRAGPNAQAFTTWWNIMSEQPVDPNYSNTATGDCNFGASINLVGVNLKEEKIAAMCDSWWFERNLTGPANMHEAQLARRMKQRAG